MSETSSSEASRGKAILKAMFNGEETMIIELRTYIEVGKLLIEKESAGSQAQVIYWARPEGYHNRVAVRMEGRTGEANWVQGHIPISLHVGNENRYAYEHCGAINGASVGNKTEIDSRERGLEPPNPRTAV